MPARKKATKPAQPEKLARTEGEALDYASTFEVRALDELTEYPGNSRDHSDEQIALLAQSIKEFGVVRPVVVDAQGVIRAGHGICRAARSLGLQAIPTVRADHLSDAQLRAYVLADNKLAELSTWDTDALRIEVGELRAESFDLMLTGFDSAELDFTDWNAEMPIGDGDGTGVNLGDEMGKLSVTYPEKHKDAITAAIAAALENAGIDGVQVK